MHRCTAQFAAIKDALDRGLPLGTVRSAAYLGFANPGRYVWDACPICDTRRFVPLRKRGRWCFSCSRHRATARPDREAVRAAARRRHQFLVALGRAAEKHGWRPPGWEGL